METFAKLVIRFRSLRRPPQRSKKAVQGAVSRLLAEEPEERPQYMEVEWKEGRAVGLGHMDGSAIEGSETEGMFTDYGWRPGVGPDGPEEEYSDDEIWGFDPKEQAKNAAARAEQDAKMPSGEDGTNDAEARDR
jgi:hypothetical protein